VSTRPIAIVGAGSIGVAWALTFARGGRTVRVQDPDAARRDAVAAELNERLVALDRHGLLDESVATIAARVTVTAELAVAVADAEHVQECAPERVDLKRELFTTLDGLAPADASLASSSSFLPASQFADEVPGRARCLVAHPGNPPHLLPAVELVPAPFTDQAVVDRLAALLESVGMSPVRLKREVDGFVFNRLQGAVLREAYCLVRDGVIDVEDLDRVVRDGLGRRWAVVGPFETVDLNTRGGIAAHAERMGPSYERMGAERGQHDPWTPELVDTVDTQRRRQLPLDRWDERIAWRDERLLAVAAALAGAGEREDA